MHQQTCSHLPVTRSKGVEEGALRGRSKDDKEVNVKNPEVFSVQKDDQRRMRRHEKGRGEGSSYPAVADGSRRDKKLRGNGPNACKDGSSVQVEATTSESLKSFQPLKPKRSLDRNCERESREQRNLKVEKGWRGGKTSHFRQDVEGPHKAKASKEADRVHRDRSRSSGERRNADTRSDNNRKRKGEKLERNETQRKSESPNVFDRKKQKNEKKKKEMKTQPLTVRDIWEEGIKVKPQKKISININLDGKREKHDQESVWSQSVTGEKTEQDEKTGTGGDKSNNETGAKASEDFSRDREAMCEEKIKPGEANKMWEKSSFREVEVWDKTAAEEKDAGEKTKSRQDEDFDLWKCALKQLVEEKEKRGEEVTREEKRSMTGREGEARRRSESQGQEMAELVPGKSMCDKNRAVLLEESKAQREEVKNPTSAHRSPRHSPNTAVDDGRSECYWFYSSVYNTTLIDTL